MTKAELLKQWEYTCNELVKMFCKKQDMQFLGWVGNKVGGIAECNDFYFNIDDIVLDLNSNQRKGIIINWYYDNLEFENKHINYYSYTKGLRVKDIK